MIDRKMNNKAEEIKELLALYYEGKTTKSQEDMKKPPKKQRQHNKLHHTRKGDYYNAGNDNQSRY